MLSFTLDTNCVIAVDEGRPAAAFILELAQAHKDGRADVAVVAIMASEKQKDAQQIANFNDFKERLKRLGLGTLGLALPLAYWGVSYWDAALWSGPEEDELEERIHGVLFPNRPFHHSQDFTDAETAAWLNGKCDVLALWSHVHAGRHVFVTTDRNFHKQTKKPALMALGAGTIIRPEDAIHLLQAS